MEGGSYRDRGSRLAGTEFPPSRKGKLQLLKLMNGWLADPTPIASESEFFTNYGAESLLSVTDKVLERRKSLLKLLGEEEENV